MCISWYVIFSRNKASNKAMKKVRKVMEEWAISGTATSPWPDNSVCDPWSCTHVHMKGKLLSFRSLLFLSEGVDTTSASRERWKCGRAAMTLGYKTGGKAPACIHCPAARHQHSSSTMTLSVSTILLCASHIPYERFYRLKSPIRRMWTGRTSSTRGVDEKSYSHPVHRTHDTYKNKIHQGLKIN